MKKVSPFDLILRTLLIGAGAFDLVAGFVVLVAPRFLSTTLKLPLPSELFYVWFIGLLQIGLALAYLIAGFNPLRHMANLVLAAGMRVAMSGLLIFVGLSNGFILLTVLGLVEGFVGLAHAVYVTRLSATSSAAKLSAAE